MRIFLAIAMAFAVADASRGAEFRIAVVKVSYIYKSLDATKTSQAGFEAERAAITRDPRVADIMRVNSELETIRAQLNDKANPLDATTRTKLRQNYDVKLGEYTTLQMNFETFRAERNKEISTRMVKSMRETFKRIVSTARKLGEEQGFDCVWDISGETNTGLPLVLYCKNPHDITADVLTALGAKPAATAATSPAKPTAPTAEKPAPTH